MEILVEMGKLAVARAPYILRAIGLGSCVAVVLYDQESKIGGLAHVVFPFRKKSLKSIDSTKYTDIAINTMVYEMEQTGARLNSVKAKVFGGANMFPDIITANTHMDIGKQNIRAVRNELKLHNIEIIVEEVGGYRGRTVSFDTSDGSVEVKTANSILEKY